MNHRPAPAVSNPSKVKGEAPDLNPLQSHPSFWSSNSTTSTALPQSPLPNPFARADSSLASLPIWHLGCDRPSKLGSRYARRLPVFQQAPPPVPSLRRRIRLHPQRPPSPQYHPPNLQRYLSAAKNHPQSPPLPFARWNH
ncbi:hypothetical protein CCHR01_04389 [Colletotrichum chrysophilum]|uniref:Uncharacterized protein n=1 Tax=Colletotrichum chrysophilum TaxID=1836956 RepID=A0AAD9EIK3_9PEZI|nr:hypothetical protein CCHR01_04389 [Colletotrichum chrysophilum]